MTHKKKMIYLAGLFAIFIIVIPALIFYSSGYRLNSKFRLVKTGGIYLENSESDVIVKLNGKEVKKAGIIEKNILIRNLIPETYYVTVEKNGYRTWKKNIKVEEKMVEVCYPLLIPLKLNPQLVPKYLTGKDDKGKSRRELNDEYSEAIKLFETYGKPEKGVIPVWSDRDIKKYNLGANRRLYKKVFLFRKGNKVYVKWTGIAENRPFFINSPDEKIVYFPDKNILSFGFFPGRNDSMIVLLEDQNLYAVEIDTRFDIQNVYKIAAYCNRFAIIDEFLYFFAEKAMYRIDFQP